MSRSFDLFSNTQDLVLAGYGAQGIPYGGLAARLIATDPVQQQFDRFADRVIRSVGRSYLPIYRMADGEFAFLVGWQRSLTDDSLLKRVRGSLSRFRNNVLRRRFATMWGEAYEGSDRAEALRRLEASIRNIARDGILAVYFMKRGDRWGEEFIEPICTWFDVHGVTLTPSNYIPFYFVYALLNGPRRRELSGARRVLIVTHLTDERKTAIERGLLADGAASVDFLALSASRALFDVIDPSPYAGRVDLAIVAAGIGSASVLTQLAPLSIPCIDAGISIECLIDPARRLERPFLLDDERRRRSA
jgi:hypothetical protein